MSPGVSRRRKPSGDPRDIRVAEVGPLEQQWLAGRSGRRIGRAVAEVEARAMAAFAEAPEGVDDRCSRTQTPDAQ